MSSSRTYHQLPTLWTQLLFCVIAVAPAIAFPVVAEITFNELPNGWSLKAGQIGVLLTYMATVIGGLSLFWNHKATENEHLAKRDIQHGKDFLEVLEDAERRNPGIFQDQIFNTRAVVDRAETELAVVERYPLVLRITGIFAIILIGIGSILQIVEMG